MPGKVGCCRVPDRRFVRRGHAASPSMPAQNEVLAGNEVLARDAINIAAQYYEARNDVGYVVLDAIASAADSKECSQAHNESDEPSLSIFDLPPSARTGSPILRGPRSRHPGPAGQPLLFSPQWQQGATSMPPVHRLTSHGHP